MAVAIRPRSATTGPGAEPRGAGLRVALVDPGDFSPPYDEALARGLAEIGCRVRLWGMAGKPAGDAAVEKVGLPRQRPAQQARPTRG